MEVQVQEIPAEEMEIQNKDVYGFNTFPPEVWMKVVRQMHNFYDAENLCQAYEQLRPFVAADLDKLKEKNAINLVMQKGFVSAANGLKMRLVSKEWRKRMDDFYNKPHDKKSCLPPSYFPAVTVKVPLDETRSRKVEDIAVNKNCRFVGGRMKLLLSKTKEPTRSPIEDEAFQSVCERATYLTIVEENRYDFDDREIQDFGAPFLRNMGNVTSIVCDVDLDIELIQSLPTPEKLLLIKTTNRNAKRPESSDNWEAVFQSVKTNLKIFDCKVFSRGMENALYQVKFENLEELGAAEHYLDDDDDLGEDEQEEDGSSFVMNLYQARFKALLPKLKTIKVPFFGGNLNDDDYDDDDDHEWDFPAVLMQVTNNLRTLEEIELNVSQYVDLSLSNYPIGRCIGRRRGSRTVRRLVITFDGGELNNGKTKWCFNLARVWPSLRSLQIGRLQYERRGNNAWESVNAGLQKFCTEC